MYKINFVSGDLCMRCGPYARTADLFVYGYSLLHCYMPECTTNKKPHFIVSSTIIIWAITQPLNHSITLQKKKKKPKEITSIIRIQSNYTCKTIPVPLPFVPQHLQTRQKTVNIKVMSSKTQ